MLLAINWENVEKSIGNFFGKIGKFFIKIYDTIVSALDKFLPHEVSLILLIVIVAFIIIYLFTQKINK